MSPGPAEVLDRARLDLLEGAAPDAVAAAAAGHDHVGQRVQAVVVVVAAAAAVEVEEGAAVGAGDAALPAGARGGEQQRELGAKGERLQVFYYRGSHFVWLLVYSVSLGVKRPSIVKFSVQSSKQGVKKRVH